jgi:hypothetical protein
VKFHATRWPTSPSSPSIHGAIVAALNTAPLRIAVPGHAPPEQRRIRRQAGQVVAGLDADLVADPPLGFDQRDAPQAGPSAGRVEVGQVLRIAQCPAAPTLDPSVALVERRGDVPADRCPGGARGDARIRDYWKDGLGFFTSLQGEIVEVPS